MKTMLKAFDNAFDNMKRDKTLSQQTICLIEDYKSIIDEMIREIELLLVKEERREFNNNK